jgi:deoxyribonuclease-4
MGALNTVEDFEKAIHTMENVLGKDRVNRLHVHFSRIEYTQGGEKKHWTLADTQYGPEFEHLAEVLVKRQMQPTIICESRECMAEDAYQLQQIYTSMAGRLG